jgi:hypothetical protein
MDKISTVIILLFDFSLTALDFRVTESATLYAQMTRDD